jgi:hypothetical protein
VALAGSRQVSVEIVSLYVSGGGEVLPSATVTNFWSKRLDEDVSASITQTWTDQAIKCYLSSANCEGCTIPKGGYSFACQMNKVVPVLLKTLGTPPPRQLEKLRPFMPAVRVGA